MILWIISIKLRRVDLSGVSRALVSGGTGYLGKYLCELLLNKGIEVVCLVRETSNISSLPEGVVTISSLNKIKSCHYFFHLATCYGRNGESDQEVRKVNVEYPTEICQKLDDEAIVFNFSTSLPANVNIYAQTKFEFSDYMNHLNRFKKFINLEVEQFYGPADKTFIGSILKHLQKNTPEIPLTDGRQKRDFIYIDDLLNAVDCLLNNLKKIDSGYSNISIGSGKSYSIKEVVELLKELTGSSSRLDFGKIPYRANEPLELKADITFLQSLGWDTKVDLKDGLQKTIQY